MFRTTPRRINLWNPRTVKSVIEGGWDSGAINVYIGHQSHHGVNVGSRAVESYDYVGVRYRLLLR